MPQYHKSFQLTHKDDKGRIIHSVLSQDDTYPLRRYIELVMFPSFLTTAAHTRSFNRTPWPIYPHLGRPVGTRKLKSIESFDELEFAASCRSYVNTMADVTIPVIDPDMEIPTLKLASWDLIATSLRDITLLERLNMNVALKTDWEDFNTLMTDYVLKTASECIRLMEHLDTRSDIYQSTLKFSTRMELCNICNVPWDVNGLPSTGFSNLPLAIISVPPWSMNHEQFSTFAEPREFELGLLDLAPNHEDLRFVPAKLWAVIYDACFEQGRLFVVTNYLGWVFGEFSLDYTKVRLSSVIEPPLQHLDGRVDKPMHYGCNVLEHLIHWIQLARGATPYNTTFPTNVQKAPGPPRPRTVFCPNRL